MQIRFTSRNNNAITDEFREQLERRLSKVTRLLRKVDLVDVALSQERNWCVLDVLVHADGFLVRAEERGPDPRTALDLTMDKLERQVRKYHDRLVEHGLQRPAPPMASALPAEEEPVEALLEEAEDESLDIVRSKRFALKPMSPEEAVAQMEALGHDFFVFTNADTGQANVIYRRRRGGYGLIEPGFE